MGDSGVTGRKIIVDTYGGMGRHGGGAFSGKDPVEGRSLGCYMARYIAKNIVAAGPRAPLRGPGRLRDRRRASRSRVMVDTFGTGKVADEKIASRRARACSTSRPRGIIESLDLLRPIYQKTAAYGHFGRSEKEFTWERTDKKDALRDAAGASKVRAVVA